MVDSRQWQRCRVSRTTWLWTITTITIRTAHLSHLETWRAISCSKSIRIDTVHKCSNIALWLRSCTLCRRIKARSILIWYWDNLRVPETPDFQDDPGMFSAHTWRENVKLIEKWRYDKKFKIRNWFTVCYECIVHFHFKTQRHTDAFSVTVRYKDVDSLVKRLCMVGVYLQECNA